MSLPYQRKVLASKGEEEVSEILRVLIAVTKVDPKKALVYVMAAIGVLTTATEALKEVAKALSGF